MQAELEAATCLNTRFVANVGGVKVHEVVINHDAGADPAVLQATAEAFFEDLERDRLEKFSNLQALAAHIGKKLEGQPGGYVLKNHYGMTASENLEEIEKTITEAAESEARMTRVGMRAAIMRAMADSVFNPRRS